MNTELASILKDRISTLPFVDVLAGLVKTVEDAQPIEEGGVVRNRFPVAWDTNLTDACSQGEERALVPDSSKKSIIYFEDFGSTPGRGGRNGDIEMTSVLRLVAWVNKGRFELDPYQPVGGYCIAAIVNRVALRFANIGMFKRLTVRPSRIPIADASLFSRYTYDETVRQYLMPPYEVFAVDFTCTSFVNPGCGSEPDFTQTNNC